MSMIEKYVLLEKRVGETPLQCLENWRQTRPDLAGLPLAYAGRLDPMASGKLLILIGAECKNQEQYHNLDKAYTFAILFGVSSDSGDVLGEVKENSRRDFSQADLNNVLGSLIGEISLPYPIFSSRTVQNKPLHTWAMEGRLAEITIPLKTSTIYKLELKKEIKLTRSELVETALQKIDLLPPVTDLRKALGNDFRRPLVRTAWQKIAETGSSHDLFSIITVDCIASSGTYMRSLAEVIAQKLGTAGLAYSIHRSVIGRFSKETDSWLEQFS